MSSCLWGGGGEEVIIGAGVGEKVLKRDWEKKKAKIKYCKIIAGV